MDLHDVTFIDPFGLVLLACAAHTLTEPADRTYRLPGNPSVANYCARIGLVEVLSAAASLEPVSGRPVMHTVDRSDVLSEVQRVEATSGATPPVADLVYERLQRSPAIAEVVFCCAAEATNNVSDHARSFGYAAAQVYRKGSGRERITLAIGDPGRGIAASLSHRHGTLSDADALRLVVEDRASGTRDQGTGIASMLEIVDDLGGTFVLRSGTAVARRTQRRSTITESVEIMGTAVGIELPCG
jgi:hypothetical protein